MIFELLLEGEQNAIPAKQLCKMLDINSRILTQQIERERRAGKPIAAKCGENPGYFIAANRREMQDYCGRLYHRAGEIFKTRRACMATIDSLPAGEV